MHEAATSVGGEGEQWRDEATEYVVTTDPTKVDFEAVHAYLTNHSYWAKGITMEVVRKAISNSLPFSVLSAKGEFAGFGRLVTDYACVAYIADVYVDPAHRKKGLSKFLVACMLKCERVRHIRGYILVTRSAHGYYSAHQQPSYNHNSPL